MLTLQQAYEIAKTDSDPHLITTLDFGADFGFLFSKEPSGRFFGGHYIVVNKQTKALQILPTIPANMGYINSGRNIPLTLLRR